MLFKKKEIVKHQMIKIKYKFPFERILHTMQQRAHVHLFYSKIVISSELIVSFHR